MTLYLFTFASPNALHDITAFLYGAINKMSAKNIINPERNNSLLLYLLTVFTPVIKMNYRITLIALFCRFDRFFTAKKRVMM